MFEYVDRQCEPFFLGQSKRVRMFLLTWNFGRKILQAQSPWQTCHEANGSYACFIQQSKSQMAPLWKQTTHLPFQTTAPPPRFSFFMWNQWLHMRKKIESQVRCPPVIPLLLSRSQLRLQGHVVATPQTTLPWQHLCRGTRHSTQPRHSAKRPVKPKRGMPWRVKALPRPMSLTKKVPGIYTSSWASMYICCISVLIVFISIYLEQCIYSR